MPSPAFTLARRCAPAKPSIRPGAACRSRWSCEAIAREGFSAVTLDMQHGMWDTASALAAIASVHLAGAAPVVRVPLWENATVSRMLDFGAEGIIAPMINGIAEASAFVQVAKYPPVGERSIGAHRAGMLARVPDQKLYIADANDTTISFAMIETRAALDNLDAIAGMPGINSLFVGPSDLSCSLSNGASMDSHSADVESRARARAQGLRQAWQNSRACIVGDADRAVAKAKQGFRFLAVASDLTFLRAGTAAQLKVLKQ